MSIPKYEELMLPLLKFGVMQHKYKDAVEHVSELFELTEEEKNARLPTGNETVIYNRTTWAIHYMVRASIMVRPNRGSFINTDEGNKLLERGIVELNNKTLMAYPSFIEFKNKKSEPNQDETGGDIATKSLSSEITPEEHIEKAYSDLSDELKSEILSRILENSPSFFESLVVQLLTSMGYGGEQKLAAAVGKSGDGGIDGIIHQDKLGLDVVYIQAKRYNPDNTVGRPELQAFVGTLAGVSAQKGVFVTTSTFSSGAIEYLRTIQQRVITINGNRLVDLMLEHQVGVRPKQTYRLHRIDEDFFVE